MRILGILGLFAAVVAVAGCNDPLGPQPWNTAPDTVELWSAGRADLIGKPSGFDFTTNRRRVVIERPGENGNWDIAVTDDGSALGMIPPGAIAGAGASSAIARVPNTTFDALLTVPNATGSIVYNDSTVVPIEDGAVYVVRTRRLATLYGSCTYYAKMEALATDVDAGTFEFRFVANPNCNDPTFQSK